MGRSGVSYPRLCDTFVASLLQHTALFLDFMNAYPGVVLLGLRNIPYQPVLVHYMCVFMEVGVQTNTVV